MITRVQIKNFRSIESVDVTLDNMTVLVGRNGSGKSSFVDAIKFVRDALRIGLENAISQRQGFENICRHTDHRKTQIEIILTVAVEDEDFYGTYELTIGRNKDTFKIIKEKADYSVPTPPLLLIIADQLGQFSQLPARGGNSFERRGKKWVSGRPIKNSSDSDLEPTVLALPFASISGGFHTLYSQLSGDFYTIYPNTLRQPQKLMNSKVLTDHGDNFVSVLRNLIQQKQKKQDILAVLSRVVDGIKDIRVRSTPGFLFAELQYDDLPRQKGVQTKRARWFDLSLESDGTLRMLSILAAMYQGVESEELHLLALEEPEIALHPGALAILADELKSTSERRQLLITTQSPDLIARFDAKDLRVVERVNGVTQIAPIEESQRQVIEDQLFNAGDLLRIEGLRGARPISTDDVLAA